MLLDQRSSLLSFSRILESYSNKFSSKFSLDFFPSFICAILVKNYTNNSSPLSSSLKLLIRDFSELSFVTRQRANSRSTLLSGC